MKYKVLITTSGIGSRLGELTKYTNKALVRVGKKPAISYIIESYPKDVPLVITVGYFSDHIKEFISLAYPDRDIDYVEVDNYSGPGSSLGYSMLQAKDKLQCPFIYHASDTIITESVDPPEDNWIGVFDGDNASQYASWDVIDDNILIFNDKGAINFDYIHIGLVGIYSYNEYWNILENIYKENPDDGSLNDCRVIVSMIKSGNRFRLRKFKEWYDIGNASALQDARKNIFDHLENLDKLEETVFIFDDFVIKFFSDQRIVKERSERALILSGLVPKLEGATRNFYRYEYKTGDLYANIATPSDFSAFLFWLKKKLWIKNNEVEAKEFKEVCTRFYFDKTNERISRFFRINQLNDQEHIINGENVPTIKKILEEIDFSWLSDAEQYQFHGDLILDNILKTKDGFCLLDWRHNFGGLLISGDMYYDIAKLNHNLTVNHEIVNENLFSVILKGNKNVLCDILRKNNLVECQDILFDFARKEGYDVKKIKVLTGIIWLNMSPLHHHPFNLFLYYFGKLHLWRAIKENK